MKHLLALDQGTTSTRSIVFREDGTVAGVGRVEIEQIFPRPGWVEHNPNEIRSSQINTIAEALRSAGLSGRDVAGVGIANQRETTIVWDRATGDPVYNAVVASVASSSEAKADLLSKRLSPTYRGESK